MALFFYCVCVSYSQTFMISVMNNSPFQHVSMNYSASSRWHLNSAAAAWTPRFTHPWRTIKTTAEAWIYSASPDKIIRFYANRISPNKITHHASNICAVFCVLIGWERWGRSHHVAFTLSYAHYPFIRGLIREVQLHFLIAVDAWRKWNVAPHTCWGFRSYDLNSRPKNPLLPRESFV